MHRILIATLSQDRVISGCLPRCSSDRLQSPLLLAIRLYWGWQFMQDGWGKLTHLDKVTEFFTSLNLPAPHMTAALLCASVEFCRRHPFRARHRCRASRRWCSSST